MKIPEKCGETTLSKVALAPGDSHLFAHSITQYGSTVYIGIAMVFVFPPYIREIQFLLPVSSQFDF